MKTRNSLALAFSALVTLNGCTPKITDLSATTISKVHRNINKTDNVEIYEEIQLGEDNKIEEKIPLSVNKILSEKGIKIASWDDIKVKTKGPTCDGENNTCGGEDNESILGPSTPTDPFAKEGKIA